MWIVAIDALYGAFVHAMLVRHRELGANGIVAAIAEVGLLLCEQGLGGVRPVDGVARVTGNVSLRV